jgi:NADH-quinone oxidoreductase subunit H|uniref:NADH-quinone oxidoreductase subunit H n=1 Tax=candidate division WOR-3 bacterium TaxID=2052148 RepID=A0A7V3PUJ3_UNCW3
MSTWLTGWRLVLGFVASTIFVPVVGLVLTWVDRLVSARVQWRKGPPFYQPFADILKLLLKQTVVPQGAARTVFLFAPLVGIAGMSIVAMIIFYSNFNIIVNQQSSFVGDIIVLLYLFALVPLAFIIGASASRNPVAAVGASREMTLYLGYELPFLLALLVPIVKVAQKWGVASALRIGGIVAFQQEFGPILYSVSGVIAGIIILFTIQAKLGYVPFDIPEAEQEIMSGVLVEYSGAPLAAFRITRAMIFVLLPLFLITILWGGIRDWWAVLKFLLIVVLIVLMKNTNPRLTIHQALKFFWFILTPLGIVGLILAFIGL